MDFISRIIRCFIAVLFLGSAATADAQVCYKWVGDHRPYAEGTASYICSSYDGITGDGYSVTYTPHAGDTEQILDPGPFEQYCDAVAVKVGYPEDTRYASPSGYGMDKTNTDCPPVTQYFVSVLFSKKAQCGPTCNGISDPVNPTSGAVYSSEMDTKETGNTLPFTRFYNSTSDGNADLSSGWRHTFSRNVVVRYSTVEAQAYVQSSNNSSLYADPDTACTTGFAQIQSQVANWAGATTLYTNGNCQLTKNGVWIGTVPVYSSGGTVAPAATSVAYDVVRDDGQLIRLTVLNGVITAPPTINMTLQQTSTGYTLTDASDTVEQYDTTGKLLSITTRSGVVQTMSYDTAGRLSGVTDSFGHSLILNYDSNNRLSTVTRQ